MHISHFTLLIDIRIRPWAMGAPLKGYWKRLFT